MKIKLSKSQWENAGIKAGWLGKTANDQGEKDKKECTRCHGQKYITQKIKNLTTKEYIDHIVGCDMCNGKGYITQDDIASYLHSMGVGPCPFNCDCKQEAGKVEASKSNNLTKVAQLDSSTEEKANRIIIMILASLDELLTNPRGAFNIERKITGRDSDDKIESKIKSRCSNLLSMLVDLSEKYPALQKEFQNDFRRVTELYTRKFNTKQEQVPLEIDESTNAQQIEDLKNKALDDFNSGKISKERLNSIMTELVATTIKRLKKIAKVK